MGTQQVWGSGFGHFSEYVCVSVKYRITIEITTKGGESGGRDSPMVRRLTYSV